MVELRLKTSKEARAQLRSEAVDLCVRVPADPDPFCDAPFSSAPNYYSREEEAHYILDDIDTLLAEVERLRIRCRLASTTLEFVRGAWVPAGDEDALALVTYATSPSPETGHVGWCWWAKGKMGDAGSIEGAMLRAERALETK